MLTHDEIIRAVRRIRYSSRSARERQQAPSLSMLARAAGLRRTNLYRTLTRGTMSRETADRLRMGLDVLGVSHLGLG